jgi:hypothetical protein
MRQRATMAILAALVTLPAFAAFPDIPEQHWAKSAVEAATAGNQPIMQADKDGKFHGEKPVTHADTVKAFNRMLIYIAQHTTAKFDLKGLKTDNPAWSAVKDASNKPLTRYELAGIMNGLYTQAEAKEIVQAKQGNRTFSDLGKAPAWAKTAVDNVVNKYGLMVGFPDGKFHGDKPVTRFELAALSSMMLGSDWRPIKERPTPKPTATPTPEPTPEPTPVPTPEPTPVPPPSVTFPAYRLEGTVLGLPALTPLFRAGSDAAATAGFLGFAPVGSDAATVPGAFGTPYQYAGTFKGRQDIGDFFIGERVHALPGIYTNSMLSADGQLNLGWNFQAGDNVRFRPYISGGAIYNTMLGQTALSGTGRDTLIPHAGYGLVFDWKPLSWLGFGLDLANRHALALGPVAPMNLGGGTGNLPGAWAMMPYGNFYLDLYPVDNFGISLGYGAFGLPALASANDQSITLQHGPTLGINLAF